jgi:hypothetical protein
MRSERNLLARLIVTLGLRSFSLLPCGFLASPFLPPAECSILHIYKSQVAQVVALVITPSATIGAIDSNVGFAHVQFAFNSGVLDKGFEPVRFYILQGAEFATYINHIVARVVARETRLSHSSRCPYEGENAQLPGRSPPGGRRAPVGPKRVPGRLDAGAVQQRRLEQQVLPKHWANSRRSRCDVAQTRLQSLRLQSRMQE